VVTRYADGRADLIEVYQDAFLVRRQSGSAITYYQYSTDGLLVQTTHVIDGRLQEARLYGYQKAALATILTVSDDQSNLRTFGMLKDQAYYAYSDAEGGQLFTTFAKGRTIGEYWIGEQMQEKLSVTTYEDGAFSILRKRGDEEILQQYDASGLLVSSKYPSYLVEYRYNENRVLIEERTIEAGGKMTSKKYEEGKLVESTEEAGGRVVQSTRYNEDGSSVQTLYTEGRRYADVTYAVDGKRVLSITYY
jgi:YD repeat-containing protein